MEGEYVLCLMSTTDLPLVLVKYCAVLTSHLHPGFSKCIFPCYLEWYNCFQRFYHLLLQETLYLFPQVIEHAWCDRYQTNFIAFPFVLTACLTKMLLI